MSRRTEQRRALAQRERVAPVRAALRPADGWYVWHGGAYLGLGRWSGPHATRDEAGRSAAECRRVNGGDEPIVTRFVDGREVRCG